MILLQSISVNFEFECIREDQTLLHPQKTLASSFSLASSEASLYGREAREGKKKAQGGGGGGQC